MSKKKDKTKKDPKASVPRDYAELLRQKINDVGKGLHVTRVQLQDLQQRFRVAWNTGNVNIRIMQKLAIHVGLVPDMEGFQKLYQEVYEELLTEHQEIEKRELERIKAQQAAGEEATPMQGTVVDIATKLKH